MHCFTPKKDKYTYSTERKNETWIKRTNEIVSKTHIEYSIQTVLFTL